ncbi:MAG: helix-turn-helix domain-containing protein [Clostridia bacterium]|nr:helix-turn-helix domain-containing protein [Clostridia bacterium]
MNYDILNLSDELYETFPIYFKNFSNHHDQEPIFRPNGFANEIYQILFVVRGNGILETQGKKYILHPGCAFFTSPNIPHNYRATDSMITAYLTFKGKCIPQILKHFNCDGFLFRQNMSLHDLINRLSDMANEYFTHKRTAILSAQTYEFIMHFFEDAFQKDMPEIEKINLYLEQHFNETVTLQQLADLYGTSVSKLCKDFKAAFGCTVFEHILDLRLLYARSALQSNSHAKIKTVANACGFSDVSYFCKAYKKKYGHTPHNTPL